MVSRRRVAVAVVCLALLSCTSPAGQPPAPPAAQPATRERYVASSQEACDRYLGALLTMAKNDEELDTAREDASRELFVRRADDIAGLYARYRSEIASLDPPEAADIRAVHAEIVELMGDDLERIEAVAEAHSEGDEEEAAANVADSSRTEDAIAALQRSVGVRPCGA